MKIILRIISFIGLALTIVPSMLVFSGTIVMKTHFVLMGFGLVFWFASAPLWMKSKSLEEEKEK